MVKDIINYHIRKRMWQRKDKQIAKGRSEGKGKISANELTKMILKQTRKSAIQKTSSNSTLF